MGNGLRILRFCISNEDVVPHAVFNTLIAAFPAIEKAFLFKDTQLMSHASCHKFNSNDNFLHLYGNVCGAIESERETLPIICLWFCGQLLVDHIDRYWIVEPLKIETHYRAR